LRRSKGTASGRETLRSLTRSKALYAPELGGLRKARTCSKAPILKSKSKGRGSGKRKRKWTAQRKRKGSGKEKGKKLGKRIIMIQGKRAIDTDIERY